MILKLVEHSEKHQIKIHISIGIYSENVNLGFGSHFNVLARAFGNDLEIGGTFRKPLDKNSHFHWYLR